MAPGGRRVARGPRYSPAPVPRPPSPEPVSVNRFIGSDLPILPKHIPFPNIPQDGELLFETMTFILTSVAAALQFLNLYRTVWWLPHSYTNQAVNFYLIDPHVVAFIMVILARRLLLSLCVAILHSILASKLWPQAAAAARMFILGLVVGALAWCTYFIMLKHPLVKIFYLSYPALVYILLFGLQAGPLLEISNGDRPPLHCCLSNPVAIRNEVNILRIDFNLRIKKILFGSVVGAYYTSFIPCCFAQPFLYYDAYAATQQLALVWGSLFTRYASFVLAAHYCDVLHRSALHLGIWEREDPRNGAGPPDVAWCSRTLWARGARVGASGAAYCARAPAVAADPTDPSQRRFYVVFKNPSMLLCVLLCLQLSLILLQLCLLFSSSHWHHFVSLSVLLFANYYTLFKLVRDYLVSWKVYKAEYMIQDKASSPLT